MWALCKPSKLCHVAIGLNPLQFLKTTLNPLGFDDPHPPPTSPRAKLVRYGISIRGFSLVSFTKRFVFQSSCYLSWILQPFATVTEYIAMLWKLVTLQACKSRSWVVVVFIQFETKTVSAENKPLFDCKYRWITDSLTQKIAVFRQNPEEEKINSRGRQHG